MYVLGVDTLHFLSPKLNTTELYGESTFSLSELVVLLAQWQSVRLLSERFRVRVPGGIALLAQLVEQLPSKQ